MENNKINRVSVDLAERSYEIIIGGGVVRGAAEYMAPVISSGNAIIVTDENVAGIHLELLESVLDDEGIRHDSVILPAGEATKSFEELEKLLEALLSKNPKRNTTLIALGGGVIGDITGFAASILLRGVKFIQIPTTLLAMVDSSVGGKTGINTKQGKNLVGSFYQPSLVIADTDLLDTLSQRDWLAGYAEVVKYGLIGDKGFFEVLEKAGAAINAVRGSEDEEEKRLYDELCNIIVSVSCKAKARVVAEDEREGGRRALLNLGHTFGHALEAEAGYSDNLLHGEAVSIGMVMAFQLSNVLGLCTVGDVDRVANHLSEVGLPVSPQEVGVDFNADNLIKHIGHDKKTKNGKTIFVLVKSIGEAFLKDDLEKDDIKYFIRQIISHDNKDVA